MNENDFDNIKEKALTNYKTYDAEDNSDNWHNVVETVLVKVVNKTLKKYDNKNALILNAGSGGETYSTKGKLIHLDIVKNTIKEFKNYIVASIENIPLKNNSIDIIICVGSVINYADFSKSIKEFNRILKSNGILIIEFERSDSGEFLFKKNHHKAYFKKTYKYNNQEHILMMYSEKYAKNLFKQNRFKKMYKYRFHTLSTLMYRFGYNEEKAYKFAIFDKILTPISYPLSHNIIYVLKKT